MPYATAPLADASDSELIFRAACAFDRMTSQYRRAIGVNAHERLAISLLFDLGPMTMSELGSGIPLSRAAVTTLVDRLEAAGYVTRGGDVEDRRRTVVTVTNAATNDMGPLLNPFMERVQALRDQLGEARWNEIRSFLCSLHEMSGACADQLTGMDDEELQAFAAQQVAKSGAKP
jgi:DNA-binding MarR family transcriptional regulator